MNNGKHDRHFDEAGAMTKDLAMLVGPDQSWQTTEEFLATLDTNLAARLSS